MRSNCPEHTGGGAREFYKHQEAHRYTSRQEVNVIQEDITRKALELLHIGHHADNVQVSRDHAICLQKNFNSMVPRRLRPPTHTYVQAHPTNNNKNKNSPLFILDIGCGSCISSRVLSSSNFHWLGTDISLPMLQAAWLLADAKTTTTTPYKGNVLLSDMSQGLPFRPNTFDAAISISAVQWLCAPSSVADPVAAADRFFTSLYTCLKPKNALAAFQIYVQHNDQVDVLKGAAARAGFFEMCVMDFPHSTQAKKLFLLLAKKCSFINNSSCSGCCCFGWPRNACCPLTWHRTFFTFHNSDMYTKRIRDAHANMGKRVLRLVRRSCGGKAPLPTTTSTTTEACRGAEGYFFHSQLMPCGGPIAIHVLYSPPLHSTTSTTAHVDDDDGWVGRVVLREWMGCSEDGANGHLSSSTYEYNNTKYTSRKPGLHTNEDKIATWSEYMRAAMQDYFAVSTENRTEKKVFFSLQHIHACVAVLWACNPPLPPTLVIATPPTPLSTSSIDSVRNKMIQFCELYKYSVVGVDIVVSMPETVSMLWVVYAGCGLVERDAIGIVDECLHFITQHNEETKR